MNPEDKLAIVKEKGQFLKKTGELGIAKEFVDLGEKVAGVETQIADVSQKVDSKFDTLSEELKKKLEEELVYEVDEQKIVESVLLKVEIPKPIKGEPGKPGKDYVLTSKDKQEIASKIEVPIVEKLIETIVEKTEVIKEQPIVTNEIVEVAVAEEAIEIKDKLETLRGSDRLDAKYVKNLPKSSYSVSQGGGVGQFTQLADVPSGYSGAASKVVSVKSDETGLEFTTNAATQTLAQTLALGNTTGANNIVVSTGQKVIGQTDLLLSDSGGNNYYYAGPTYIFQQWYDGLGLGNTDYLLQGNGTELFSHTGIAINSDSGIYSFYNGTTVNGILSFTGLATTDKTFTFPNTTGTVALVGVNSIKTLFDYYADVTVGGAEADIFSSTIPAARLANNGEKITASYSGNFITGGTEMTDLLVKFDATGATTLWDSTGLAPATGTTSWRVTVELIRVSATVVRYVVGLNTTGATGYVYCTSGEITGLTLSATTVLKLRGASTGVGSGSGDIVGKQGYVQFIPAA